MRSAIVGLIAASTLFVMPCSVRADSAVDLPEIPKSNVGPDRWDASGRVRCSLGRETFDRTCAFRVVRHRPGKVADFWIRNMGREKADYRFLRFVNESFAGNDGSKVTWQRQGNNWQVIVGGEEFYLIPSALIDGK